MDKAGDVVRGQITEGLESPAKELKFLSEFLHGAQAKEGPSASGLT